MQENVLSFSQRSLCAWSRPRHFCELRCPPCFVSVKLFGISAVKSGTRNEIWGLRGTLMFRRLSLHSPGSLLPPVSPHLLAGSCHLCSKMPGFISRCMAWANSVWIQHWSYCKVVWQELIFYIGHWIPISQKLLRQCFPVVFTCKFNGGAFVAPQHLPACDRMRQF